MNTLQGMKVAILVENGFEQVELEKPREALDDEGAETHIVSPRSGRVRGWQSKEWGDELPVDVPLDDARADDYDALLLPGGVMNPDALRWQPKAVEFVKAFFDAGKPVAVICHGPWTGIGRRHLPWSVDGDRSRRCEGTAHHVMAIAQNRSQERRRAVGG